MLSTLALCVLLLWLALPSFGWPPERAPARVPTPEQLAWQDLEFGMFCHFGPNTFHDVEWGDGTAPPDSFCPTDFDPRQWVAAAQSAGMKYLIVTAKHHDGFCLWPTRQTDYCVRSSKWCGGNGDVIREVAAACHEAGLQFGIYLSPWDRHEPSYPDNKAYDRFYMAQMTELLTNYGKIAVLWCDGAGGEGHIYDWEAYYRHLKALQPSCLQAIAGVADIRWVGNEDGLAPDPLWNVVNVGGADYWWPAECDARIRANWFWHSDDAHTLKPLSYLLDMYHRSVGHGANLLLNVGPDRRGLLPEPDVVRLRELGEALRTIYDHDLLPGAALAASSQRPEHPAVHATDGSLSTYWLPAPEDTTPWLEARFPQPVALDRTVTMEAIHLGQRVRRYAIDIFDGEVWHRAVHGTSIGHKKIDILPAPITALAVRLVIIEATDPPAFRCFSAYLAPEHLRAT